MKKIVKVGLALLMLGTNAMALENNLSLKLGSIKGAGADINSYGVEWAGFKQHGEYIISGLAIGGTALDGNSDGGWSAEVDLRFGAKLWDKKFYALGGGYTFSLPNSTKNTQGYHYGVGMGMVAFKHLSLRLEYKIYTDVEATTNGLDGAYFITGYKF